jgi:hypothetical protein
MTSGPGRSEEEGVLACGPGVSAREEGSQRTSLGYGGTGPWADSGAGPDRSPGLFSFFSVFFFFFLFYFLISISFI